MFILHPILSISTRNDRQTSEGDVISITETELSRRRLLVGGAVAGAARIAPTTLFSPTSTPESVGKPPVSTSISGPETRLALRCVHTDQHCDALLMRGDRFDTQGVAELNETMRDWRTREVTAIDPALLLALARLHRALEATSPFDLISGYRSPHTNAALGARSGEVARKSQHMLGKAADIALPGVSTDRIRRAALALRAGGVGHYPRDGFVHVDTGRLRFW